jgi:hypothetical protein
MATSDAIDHTSVIQRADAIKEISDVKVMKARKALAASERKFRAYGRLPTASQ